VTLSPSRSRLKALAFSAVVLGTLCTPLASLAQAAAKPLTKVSFRLDWKAGGQHAPFYLAKARGYYAAEGLDVTLLSGSGSSDSVKQLGAGAVDLAMVDALVLVQAAEQGVPIKAVAAYYQRTPIVLLSPKAKPVTDPKQLLSGLKIGSKRASATYQGLTALLAVNSIDAKKVNLVDIGFGVQPLLVGQVDALMGFTMNEAIEAETGGMPVTELSIADYGVVAYGLTMATNDKFLQANPSVVRAFLRATRRGVEATVAEPAAAVQSVAAAASETDVPREMKVLAKTLPFWSAKGAPISGFGAQSLQGWQQTVETAQRVGLVEKAPAAKDLFVVGLEK
jgi:NitT/TauT family transport system substrate-binding protein